MDKTQGNNEECFLTDDVNDVQYRIPMPKLDRQKTPISILTATTKRVVNSKRMYRVLFDTGSTKMLIRRSCIPAKARPAKLSSATGINTMNGTCTVNEVVALCDVCLPEFTRNIKVDEIKAKTRYDIILGSDFLYKAGININYIERNISWCEISIPLRDPFKMKDEDYKHG